MTKKKNQGFLLDKILQLEKTKATMNESFHS